MNKGFTLFIAIVVMGTLLLIASGIITVAVKQALISTAGRDSQYAFYAADTGMECALYWDVANPAGYTAFDISSGSQVRCNYHAGINPGNQWTVGGNAVSTFRMTFSPDPFCADVTVTKSGLTTRIESRGYNTCDSSNPRRVERAVRATY